MTMLASMGSTATYAIRALWDKTLAERETAKQALHHHNFTIYDPQREELERIAPQPDMSFEIEALNGQIARYHIYPNDLDAWDDHWSPIFRRKAAAA